MSQGNPTQHEIDTYCAEWILNGGDQSKAWRKAYPNSDMNDDGVWVSASRMHKMPKVQLRLAEMQAAQAEKDAADFDMSAHQLKEVLKKVMDAGLSGKVDSEGNSAPANLSATVSAVSEFNRMSGNHAATKSEITGKNGGAIEMADMSDREIARRIAFTLAKGARSNEVLD